MNPAIPAAAFFLLLVAFLIGIACGVLGTVLLSKDMRFAANVKRGWNNPRVKGRFVKAARFEGPKFPC